MPNIGMGLFIKRTIMDKNGKIVKEWEERPSKSYVKAWLELVGLALAHAYDANSDAVVITDTSNTGRSCLWATSGMKQGLALESPVGDVNYGLLVGTGTTPPATANYALETKIAEGTGAGQFNYAATSVSNAGIVGANMDLAITRVMINNSAGSITVKEVGLVLEHTSYFFLIVRDAVDDAVPAGNTYTVTYTFRTTV